MTKLFMCILAIFGVVASSAQVTEKRGSMALTEGRKYTVAFPQVWASPTEKPMPQPMQLLISSKVKTKIRIQTLAGINDAARIDKEYQVEANKVLKVPISTAYMNVESESRKGYGITITSAAPISVSTYQAWQGNGEMARHLPVEGWGKNYYTMNFYQDRYGNSSGYKYRPGQILIIADKDNTVVSYTPTVDTEGGIEAPSVRKGATQTVTLEKGETFLIKAKINEPLNKEWETDLTSTWIRANKPVGVVSGHTKVAIMRYPDVLPPTGMFAAEAHFVRNNVHDAMLPLEMSGTRFVTTPCMYTPTRVVGQASIEFGIDDDRGDVIRVVGLEDGTTVKAMRQDGSGLLNKFSLRKGETRLETALEVATYWESDKPILMGQYGKSYAKILPPLKVKGKDGEEAQGHPTVESGMPMLQYIPSVDRWVEYGVFHAPEGMDNFFNIVFKSSEIGKIKVDGRSLTSAFGGAMRLIKGTEFAYIRTPIGSGDHVVESTDNTVRWAAWNYGSLDGLQQGRAYGTPVSIDMTEPCDDSLSVIEQIVCGDVEGTATSIGGVSCGSIFAIYGDELTNYSLYVDEDALSDRLKTVQFSLKVLDKTQDASATVTCVTRSGKFVQKTYTYVADKITWTPKTIDFGTIAFNTPVCRVFTISNPTANPVTVKNVRVSNQLVFTCTPSGPFVIQPNGSLDVTACATINSSPEVVDTVVVELSCFELKTTELRVRGSEPKIYVSDVDWGKVPASTPGITKLVSIQNGSGVNLVLSGYDQTLMVGPNFFNPQTLSGQPLASAFPMTLPPNGKYEFNVTYSPNGVVGVQHRVDVPFYSNARVVDSIAILQGEGITIDLTAQIEPWNERVIDNVQVGLGIQQYVHRATFYNYGQLVVQFNQPFIRGNDAGLFSIINNGNTSFPTQLVGGGTNSSRYIEVAFIPNELPGRAAERDNYQAELVFPTNSSEVPEVVVSLDATAWQPQVKGADLTFAPTTIGGTTQVLTIPITNEHFLGESNPTTATPVGTSTVVITGIVITDPTTKFELLNAPSVTSPWVIKPGDVVDLQVRFVPTVSGVFQSPYVIETNVGTNGQAVYQPQYKINAVVTGGTFNVEGTHGIQYVFNSTDVFVKISHTDNVTRRFNLIDPVGPDQSRFTLTTNVVDVQPGEVKIVPVLFTPDYVTQVSPNQTGLGSQKALTQGLIQRNTQFSLDVEIEDDQTKERKIATVTGDGIYLETTNQVGSYVAKPGEYVDVAVSLVPQPERIDAAGITQVRVRLSYDPKMVKPRTNISDIITVGTQTDGWVVSKVDQTSANSLEIDVYDARVVKIPLTNSNIPLFKVRFDAFLNTTSTGTFTTPVNVYTYPVDHLQLGERKEFCLILDQPGQISIELPCTSTTRLVSLGTSKYAVKSPSPNPTSNTVTISYSIGLFAKTTVYLHNSLGTLVATLVDSDLSAGDYETIVDVSSLPSGLYYYNVVSGPFTSEIQTLTIVK